MNNKTILKKKRKKRKKRKTRQKKRSIKQNWSGYLLIHYSVNKAFNSFLSLRNQN
jgi:hypothetical protein